MVNASENILNYFAALGDIMSGSLKIASTFKNPADIGHAREATYFNFLRRSLPSKLNVTYGGYVFDRQHHASPQVDILVSSEDSFRFGFLTPDSDTAIIQSQDVLAAIESKSIMRGKTTKTGKGAGKYVINHNSDAASAFDNIRSLKLLHGINRPLTVLFALKWDGADTMDKIAEQILNYVVLRSESKDISHEFSLLPDIIHIHQTAILSFVKKGDKLAGITFNIENMNGNTIIGLDGEFVNIGFAMVCEKIAQRYKSGISVMYEGLMEAIVKNTISKSGTARIKMHLICSYPGWRNRKGISQFHEPLEIEAKF